MAEQLSVKTSGARLKRSGQRPLEGALDRWPQRWVVPLVLALPFLVMIAVLGGMTVALPIFHGSDELVYHYPTILRFAGQLPFPDLHRYGAAQTPLFHLLMAYAGKVVGYELWRLRLLQVLISWLLALAVFALLHRRLGLKRYQALALTLLFVLSPYVFGQSFRLVTDNLALLFSVMAVERLERFRECERFVVFLAGCGLIAAAIVTRQSTAFLLPVAALYVIHPGARLSVLTRLLGLAAVALAALPAGLLFLSWHGLVPVGGDPSACGLCAKNGPAAGLSLGGLEVPTMELALATLGLYGAVLFAPAVISWLRAVGDAQGRVGHAMMAARSPLSAACVGGLLLVVFPASPGPQAAGDIWKIAAHLPTVDGTSLLFWVLVPLSGAVLWTRGRCTPRPWLFVAFSACFLLSAIAVHNPWQKYFDPFAVLILLFSLRRDELDSRWRLAGAAVLALAFLAYTVDFSSHRSVPHGSASPSAAVAQPPDRSLR
ncbi:MAG: glycosyltransferase family 39 protein [Actinomycetota bacterium]|nr:glycosyltransferase family 39 protein [Actinomycetota bacterium]